MTGQKIKEQFLSEYQTFMIHNDIVVSIPFLINRIPQIFKNQEGTNIFSRLPLNLYIGISKRSGKNKEKGGKFIQFHKTKNTRSIKDINTLGEGSYKGLSELFNKTYNIIDQEYCINILSEIDKDSGVLFYETLCIGLGYLGNYIRSNELKIDFEETKKLISIFFDDPNFSSIHGLTSNKDNTTITSYSKKEIFCRDSKDFFEVNGDRPIQIDLVQYKNSIHNKNDNNSKENNTNTLDKKKNILDKNYNRLLNVQRPTYSKGYLNSGAIGAKTIQEIFYENLISDTMTNFSNFFSEKDIKSIKDMGNMEEADNLFINLNRLGIISQSIMEDNNSYIEYINFITQINTTYTAIIPLTNHPQKTFLLITKKLEAEANKSYISSSNDLTKNLGLDYITSISSELNSIKLEQDISKNIVSKLLPKNGFILNNFDGTKQIGNYGDLKELLKNDITLDTINNRIYIGSEKLDANQIHSQTMAIELLGHLLSNINKIVSNKDLGQSSYSKSKNLMNSKIIIPLKRKVEEYTGKKLPLNCYGQLHNFKLELRESNISFGIIKDSF